MDEHYINIIAANADAIQRELQEDRNAGFESALAACMDALDSEDAAIWQTSFVIAEVASEKAYGANIIGEFASKLGIGYEVARKRRRAGAFWRAEMGSWSHFVSVPTVRYSHMLDALALNDRNQIIWFMEQVAENGLSVPAAREYIKEIRGQMPSPMAVLRASGFVSEVDALMGYVTFRLEGGADLNNALYAMGEAMMVDITVREVRNPLKGLPKPDARATAAAD
jgi:hypothetical protein